MKKIQITIPSPCHENWNKMTRVEKGRYCGSCQKTVIDFSQMSDRQLVEFFKKPPASVCGHFHQDQLDRELAIPPKRIPWVRYFFTLSLPAFLFSLKSLAQRSRNVTTGDTVICLPANSTVGAVARVIPESKIIRGRVIDEEGRGIAGASIMIKDSRSGTATDYTGGYRLEIRQPGPGLIISAIGYETLQVNPDELTKNSFMLVKMDVQMLGFVLAVNKKPEVKKPEKKSRTFQKFRERIRSISQDHIPNQDHPNYKSVLEGKSNLPASSVCNSNTELTGFVGGAVAIAVRKSRPIEKIMRIADTAFSRFALYPNPVQPDGMLKISLNGKNRGNYLLALVHANGQVVQSKEIELTQKREMIELTLNQLPAGTYFVRLTNKQTGKTETEKLIVQ